MGCQHQELKLQSSGDSQNLFSSCNLGEAMFVKPLILAACLLLLCHQSASMENRWSSLVKELHKRDVTEEDNGEEQDREAQRYHPNSYNQQSHYAPKHKKKCETYYDYEYTQKCINYNDKVCYTKYTEHCSDVTKNNCKGLIKSEQVRKCTDVTELLCGLAETVEYEMATASFSVQKCHKIKE